MSRKEERDDSFIDEKEKSDFKGKKKSSRKGKSKKGFMTKSKDRGTSEATNDISWYTQIPDLVNKVANFPYGYPIGGKIRYKDSYPRMQDTVNDMEEILPGIAAFQVVLGPGYSDGATSPVTLSLRSLQSWMRHYNNGKTNYDASTLGHYFFSMDSAYALHAHLTRMLVYMQTAAFENKYMPKAIVTSMGFDFNDIQKNFAQTEAAISLMRTQLMHRPMPAHLPYFERHRWMFSNVFTDSKTAKSQLYLFRPAGLHVWEEAVDPGNPGINRYMSWADLGYEEGVSQNTPTWKLENIQVAINRILNPIIGSHDFDTIGGDVLHSFQGDVYQVPVTADFVNLPMYDEEVLNQIQNLTMLPVDPTTLDINEARGINEGWVVYTPKLSFNVSGDESTTQDDLKFLSCNVMLSSDVVDPGAGDTMISTRLTSAIVDWDVRDPGDTVAKGNIRACGSEIVLRGFIYSLDDNGQVIAEAFWPSNHVQNVTTLAGTLAFTRSMMYKESLLAKFNYRPTQNLMVRGFNTQDVKQAEVFRFRDVDNFTMLTPSNLELMHQAALMSMFTWPQITYTK